MSEKNVVDDFAALKSLLASWGLVELFQHLKDEDINIEELQMMKPHHLNELLSNFKLGTRIRFEHYFEKWRKSIYIPLKSLPKSSCCPCQRNGLTKSVQRNISNNDLDGNTLLVEEVRKPEIIKASQFLPLKPCEDEEDSIITRSVLKRNCAEIDDVSDSQITVLKILQNFGHQGRSLLEFYKRNQSFTHQQRLLLVQLIVNFFEINDYHLSLNTSYILEKQILKYFPNEKLEYYRTEKRGKIYSKYTNTKRKRAERIAAAKELFKPPMAHDTSSSADQNDSLLNSVNINNDDNEQDMDLCDDSNEQDFSDLTVKIEYPCD